MSKILEIENLNLKIQTRQGLLHAIRNLSFSMNEGETLGIVGESGSGKTLTSLAIMDLLPKTMSIQADKMNFLNKDLLTMSHNQRHNLRGRQLSMIFQNPLSALNPSLKISTQILECLELLDMGPYKQRYQHAIELLDKVGITQPEHRMKSYPHQLSGGMCQRVMIAMAISCRPKLLIADEPTTALDVTIQAQILRLLKKIQQENNMAIMWIGHDIGVVSQMTKNIQVMYAGEIIEKGQTKDVIQSPTHPYTAGLLRSLPYMQKTYRKPLPYISGLVPHLSDRPTGCQLHPRCEYSEDKCKVESPPLIEIGQQKAKCYFPLKKAEDI